MEYDTGKSEYKERSCWKKCLWIVLGILGLFILVVLCLFLACLIVTATNDDPFNIEPIVTNEAEVRVKKVL